MMKSFGFYTTLIVLVLLSIAMFMGVAQTTPQNSGLYGVTIIYIVNLGDVFQWVLKQIIATGGIMISAERIRAFSNLEEEK